MRTGLKFAVWTVAVVLCLGSIDAVSASEQRHHARKVKKQELPPLPNGPQGPIPQLPLDSVPAVPPQVTYHDGQLTILAPNSTMGDILRAVRKQTAAEMEIPPNANERVVTQLGPGTARDVIAELLNGSHFNYVLLGSPADPNKLTRIVLVAKAGGEPSPAGQNPPPGQAIVQAPMPQPDQDAGNGESTDAEAPPDENATADENVDQGAEAEQQAQDQPQTTPDQQGVKTPQQLLQEMQQRQMQMQQQNPGQPVPGQPGAYPQPPPRPQQEQ